VRVVNFLHVRRVLSFIAKSTVFLLIKTSGRLSESRAGSTYVRSIDNGYPLPEVDPIKIYYGASLLTIK
jgi:hypothetical protein